MSLNLSPIPASPPAPTTIPAVAQAIETGSAALAPRSSAAIQAPGPTPVEARNRETMNTANTAMPTRKGSRVSGSSMSMMASPWRVLFAKVSRDQGLRVSGISEPIFI